MMWVVFWTLRADTPGVFYDSYSIVDDEENARKLYDEILERPSTYAAGYGPIQHSTEHWHVRRDH